MKIQEFGLWFQTWSGVWFSTRADQWSTTIPELGYGIWYDGECLGALLEDFTFYVSTSTRYVIKLKKDFARGLQNPSSHFIGRPLTLDDFEVIPNPYNAGDV